jgi:hypothetical protein
MKRNKRWCWVLTPFAAVVFLLLGGWLVMALWNWLLPALFGWKTLCFWQALGLLALCRILFGGHGGHPVWKKHHEEMHGFTTDESERIRSEIRKRCCSDSTKPPVQE